MYVHIVFMQFLCGLQRFVPFFICFKPDTKRCKPHGTPSTWSLEDQEFCMSFSLADSHSYPGKNIPTKRFSQWHTRNIPALNNTAQGTVWQRDFYEILTRSLRDLYEIGILQGKAAGQGSRARQQGSFLLFPSLLYASLITSTLQLDSLLYSSVYSLFYYTLLFYCSLFCVSQAVKLLKSHPHEFLSQKEYVSKTCVPLQSGTKPMPQTINSSSKNDMYIMDFPLAHRLRHKKMTAA